MRFVSFLSFRLASERTSERVSVCFRVVAVEMWLVAVLSLLPFRPFYGHLHHAVCCFYLSATILGVQHAQKKTIRENIVCWLTIFDGRESMLHTHAYTYNLLHSIVRDSLIASKWHLIMNLIKMCAGKEIARIYENPNTICAITVPFTAARFLFSKVSPGFLHRHLYSL